jgi:hypothetical protein
MVSNRHFFNTSDIPKEYQRNFFHLYFDMLWFGILSGSAVSFLNVYAVRLGASGFQIGLLAAVPAVVSLALSIPAGNWLQKLPVGKAVFWTAALSRLGAHSHYFGNGDTHVRSWHRFQCPICLSGTS